MLEKIRTMVDKLPLNYLLSLCAELLIPYHNTQAMAVFGEYYNLDEDYLVVKDSTVQGVFFLGKIKSTPNDSIWIINYFPNVVLLLDSPNLLMWVI